MTHCLSRKKFRKCLRNFPHVCTVFRKKAATIRNVLRQHKEKTGCFVLFCIVVFLQRLRVLIVYLNVSFSRSALSSLSHRSKRYALATLSSGENSITVVPSLC